MFLTASDALTTRLVCVSEEAHPQIDQDLAKTVYAVFAVDDPQRFLGLVSAKEIAEKPQRIFADLLPKPAPSPVSENIPLARVYRHMEALGCWYLPVVNRRGGFMGAVTRSRILKVLWEENQRLTRRLFSLQEEERRYLSRELHDELGQYLAALRANLDCLAAFGNNQPQLQRQIDMINQLMDHLYSVVRGMIHRLRPELLDHLGLEEALRGLLEEYQNQYPEMTFGLEIHGSLEEMDEEREIALYRLVQECLTNVIRHAEARQVKICICHLPDSPRNLCRRYFPPSRDRRVVHLTVCDDGKGLPVQLSPKGLGLAGMRERVEALGGTFLLESPLNQGVCVAIELPLEESYEADSAAVGG
ncbi:MAG: histidine kinase [Methylohalobius sp. ZOD2]|nr:CBS domain-containing protein [Methylothermaceae bacterium]